MDEGFALGFVDPGGVGQLGWFGSAVSESGRVGGVGGVEGDGASLTDLGGGAVVNRGWGVESDAGVAMHVVVVVEERRTERAGIGDGPESVGERRAVFQRLELGFGVGVVIGGVRPAVERATPRSTRSWATGLDVIADPRSACKVRSPLSMPCWL